MSDRPGPLQTVPEEIKETAERMRQALGFLPNSTLIMAKRPELLKRADA